MNKVEKFLFYTLLFAIPFQTRKILWQQNWYFNEWQSISIYATDILLFLLVLFWIFRGVKPKVARYDYFLFAFVAISLLSIFKSSSLHVSAWSVVKLIEFVIFYFYIKSYAIEKFGFTKSLIALIAGATFQAIVAIAQFLMQSDLGIRILGESLLGRDMTGIASFFNLSGEKIIRAYGTTPHPNILASYFFLAIFAFYFTYLYFHIYHEGGLKHPKLNLFLLVSYPLILLAMFFTFARVIVFLWFAGFIIRSFILMNNKAFKKSFGTPVHKKKLTRILIISSIVVVAFGIIFWSEAISRIKISGDEEAVQLRIFYGKESLKAGINWLGVGSGNFVNWLMEVDPNLPRNLYQPVHNIYFLMYSETGILGLAAFLIFLIFLLRDFIIQTGFKKFYHYSFLLVFLSVLFMGIFDHFLFTIQQGRFVFWMTVALLTVYQSDGINKT